MVPVEVRKIIVESRAKGIPAEEIRKVTGVSLSAINNIQQFHFKLMIAAFRKPVMNIFNSYRRKSFENKGIKYIRCASFPLV
jgi:hypothetical protein